MNPISMRPVFQPRFSGGGVVIGPNGVEEFVINHQPVPPAAPAPQIPVTYSEKDAKAGDGYKAAFAKALKEFSYPKIVETIANNGWKIEIAPSSYDQRVKEYTVNKKSKVLVLRPATRDTLYEGYAPLNLSRGLAFAVNNGALSASTPDKKLSDDKVFQKLTNPKDSTVGLFLRELVHNHIGKAFGDGFNPYGSDFFEDATSNFFSGFGQKVLDDETSKKNYRSPLMIAVYKHVKQVLAPYAPAEQPVAAPAPLVEKAAEKAAEIVAAPAVAVPAEDKSPGTSQVETI